MEPGKKSKDERNKARHQNPLPGEIGPEQKEQNTGAHQQAEEDMIDDAEFTAHSKNDDLDEGETARLGEDETGLV